MTQLSNTIVDDTLDFVRSRIPPDMPRGELSLMYGELIEMLSQEHEVVNETIRRSREHKREEALYKHAERVYDTGRDYDCEEFS